MIATVAVSEGEPIKPEQMFLALTHKATRVTAYLLGKAKKDTSYEFLATPAAIEKQIGKQVRAQWNLRKGRSGAGEHA